MLAPEWVIGMLEVFIQILNPLEEQELKLMYQLQEAARERKIPRGVGPLTFEILRREVGDWGRFNNRRQVSSYAGLCPRESSQRLQSGRGETEPVRSRAGARKWSQRDRKKK